MYDIVTTASGDRCETPAGPGQVQLDDASIKARLGRIASGITVDSGIFYPAECLAILDMIADEDDGEIEYLLGAIKRLKE